MTTTRYWMHTSGEVYAVRLSATGEYTGVCGPLHHSEYDDPHAPLPNYDYVQEDIDWLIEHNGEFRDVTRLASSI